MKNVNFFAKAVSIYCICLLSATVTVHSATKDMTNGKWTIRFNDETRKSEFVKEGKLCIKKDCSFLLLNLLGTTNSFIYFINSCIF